jgi:hypothetical protein
MLNIPTFARIAWNTFDQKDLWRDDQESIFLATFDDFPSKTPHKHQIDYSYYNRGRFEGAPKFILHVYSFGQDFGDSSDTVNYFDKEYETMDESAGDINHWLQEFQAMVTNRKAQKTEIAMAKKSKKSSISTISLNLIFKKETHQCVLDFFKKGIKHAQLPSVLYGYDFNFKNKPNFSGNTTMFCEKKKGRYYLSIYHKFDFNTEGAEGYWFVGGLAQYAENDDMAGYIKHAETGTQLFAFRDGLPYWLNDAKIEFDAKKNNNEK